MNRSIHRALAAALAALLLGCSGGDRGSRPLDSHIPSPQETVGTASPDPGPGTARSTRQLGAYPDQRTAISPPSRATGSTIEGRVVLPPGLPHDPDLAVRLLGSTGDAKVSDDVWFRAQECLHRVPVQPDGSFRLEAPRGSDPVAVDLAGRYVVGHTKLEEHSEPEQPVVLRAFPGASLEVRLRPPRGMEAELRRHAGRGLVLLSTLDRGFGCGAPWISYAELREDFTVFFASLPAEQRTGRLEWDLAPFAPVVLPETVTEAGTAHRLTVRLRRAADADPD